MRHRAPPDRALVQPVGHLAIVQPRPGIGDMVWHIPHIRALAALARRATLVTRRRSIAHELLGPEDGIHDILYVERGQWDPPHARHQGAGGFLRLVTDLRARRFDASVCLTRSRNIALAVALARVPIRHGFGIGAQRLLQNRPPDLPDASRKRHPYDQASAWLAAAGLPLADPEPRLTLHPDAIAATRARLGLPPGSFAALGIAGSDAWKRWPSDRFAALATALLAQGWPSLVLLGGPAEQPDADAIRTLLPAPASARLVPALGWHLHEVAALLSDAAFYVGTDSAVLNIAAAVGTRAYGLFGATPILRHSLNILPIVPIGGMDEDSGMGRITQHAVLQALAAERPA